MKSPLKVEHRKIVSWLPISACQLPVNQSAIQIDEIFTLRLLICWSMASFPLVWKVAVNLYKCIKSQRVNFYPEKANWIIVRWDVWSPGAIEGVLINLRVNLKEPLECKCVPVQLLINLSPDFVLKGRCWFSSQLRKRAVHSWVESILPSRPCWAELGQWQLFPYKEPSLYSIYYKKLNLLHHQN